MLTRLLCCAEDGLEEQEGGGEADQETEQCGPGMRVASRAGLACAQTEK